MFIIIAFAEDPGSVSSIFMVVLSPVAPVPGGYDALFWCSEVLHAHGTHIHGDI